MAPGEDVRDGGDIVSAEVGNTYALPTTKDTTERERLDKLHLMFKVALGTNILAPIHPDPERIIDIGAGSGIWVIEVAKEYSSAEVVGFDLFQISREHLPANCSFEVGDLTKGLGRYPERTFDLVHSRNISCGVNYDQWRAFGSEVLRMLKPGGWAQCTESNPAQWDTEYGPEKPDWAKVDSRVFELMADFINVKDIFLDAGFEDVQVRKIIIPLGMAREPYKDSPARVVGTEAFSGAVRAFVENPNVNFSRWFPEELEGTMSVERRQFGENVAANMKHYPLYLLVYRLRRNGLTRRHSVVGRKSREGA